MVFSHINPNFNVNTAVPGQIGICPPPPQHTRPNMSDGRLELEPSVHPDKYVELVGSKPRHCLICPSSRSSLEDVGLGWGGGVARGVHSSVELQVCARVCGGTRRVITINTSRTTRKTDAVLIFLTVSAESN